MEREAIYLLWAFILAGSLSLWLYLSFRHGAERPSQRRAATFFIKSGIRHLPVMLLVGAAFWYSIAVAALSTFLPEGPLQTVAMAAGLLLVLTTGVLALVWAYRPPRRVLPEWYRAELDRAPKPHGGKLSRAWNAAMMWIGVTCLAGAYAAYRLDAPWFLIGVAAVVGAGFFAGYVVRD
ncbi:hypothetical protein ACTMS0_06820 [Micromonospora sp. H33]|uniref:hypothetical protein n=1 Tax=Micromonospora sp. H33 TaxID=3452215 RepID=UPI003F8A51DB